MKVRVFTLIFLIIKLCLFSAENSSESISYKLTFIKLSKKRYQNISARIEFSESEKESEIFYNSSLLNLIYQNIDFYVDLEKTDKRDKLVYPFIFTGKMGEELEYKEIIENRSLDTERFIKVNLKGTQINSHKEILTELSLHIKDSQSEFLASQTILLSEEYRPVATLKADFDAGIDNESYYLLLAKQVKKNIDFSKESFIYENKFDEFDFLTQDIKPKKDNYITLYYSEKESYDLNFQYTFAKFNFKGEFEDISLKSFRDQLKLTGNREGYFNLAARYQVEDDILAIGLVDELQYSKLSLGTELFIWLDNNEFESDILFKLGYRLKYLDFSYDRLFLKDDRDRVILEFFPKNNLSINMKYVKYSDIDEISIGIKIKI